MEQTFIRVYTLNHKSFTAGGFNVNIIYPSLMHDADWFNVITCLAMKRDNHRKQETKQTSKQTKQHPKTTEKKQNRIITGKKQK